MPAKSGVSGGILAVDPGQAGHRRLLARARRATATASAASGVCSEISSRLGLHVFAAEDEDALLGDAELEDAAPA